jgi:cadmium resistance protein CadD (predicted permease)
VPTASVVIPFDMSVSTCQTYQKSFPSSQIIIGQYIGMGLLIGVSLVGSLISLVIPNTLIGLIGFIPIAIGIKELLELRKKHSDDDYDVKEITKYLSRNRWTAYLPFLTVATITFSGGEKIGIFTSTFATYNSASEIFIIISVVMILTGVWCALAAHLVNQTSLAIRLRCAADRTLPFVLIGLGTYILAEAFLVPTL